MPGTTLAYAVRKHEIQKMETTGQQRVAVLIGHIREVLAGHTDP